MNDHDIDTTLHFTSALVLHIATHVAHTICVTHAHLSNLPCVRAAAFLSTCIRTSMHAFNFACPILLVSYYSSNQRLTTRRLIHLISTTSRVPTARYRSDHKDLPCAALPEAYSDDVRRSRSGPQFGSACLVHRRAVPGPAAQTLQ